MAESQCAPASNIGERIMAATYNPHANPLIRKLESIVILSDQERETLANMPMQVMELRADQDIVREGTAPPGLACFWRASPAPTRSPERASARSWRFTSPEMFPTCKACI